MFELVVIRPLGLLLRGLLRAVRFVGRAAALRGLLGRTGLRVFGEGASAAGALGEGGALPALLGEGGTAGRVAEDATAAERSALADIAPADSAAAHSATSAPEAAPVASAEARAAGDAEARAAGAAESRSTGATARGVGPEARGVPAAPATASGSSSTAIVLREAVPMSSFPVPEEALGYTRTQINHFRRIFGVPSPMRAWPPWPISGTPRCAAPSAKPCWP